MKTNPSFFAIAAVLISGMLLAGCDQHDSEDQALVEGNYEAVAFSLTDAHGAPVDVLPTGASVRLRLIRIKSRSEAEQEIVQGTFVFPEAVFGVDTRADAEHAHIAFEGAYSVTGDRVALYQLEFAYPEVTDRITNFLRATTWRYRDGVLEADDRNGISIKLRKVREA